MLVSTKLIRSTGRGIYLILILNCLFLFLNSCEKDKPDSRDKYIGDYAVLQSVNCYGPCGNCSYQRDTVIRVGYGKTDTTLNVLGRDIYLEADGVCAGYHLSIKILDGYLSASFMNGGLGCGTYENYEGNKIIADP
jgi:hypothetical protein